MSSYLCYTDEQLIEKLRQGEEAIMDYILEKYKPLVRKQCNAMYLIGGEPDDLIQEGMIGLFKAVRDYRPDRASSFFHFAELCINRQLFSVLEASNRQKHIPLNTYVSFSSDEKADGTTILDFLTASGTDPEQKMIEQEVQEEFDQKIKKSLSKMEYQVFELYMEGENYIQIAKRMGKTPKSIDNALQRIRQKVRELRR